jgi:hypothetical protein
MVDLITWLSNTVCLVLLIGGLAVPTKPAHASHQGHERHAGDDSHEPSGTGYAVPGASFRVFVNQGRDLGVLDRASVEAAVHTVIDAFAVLMQHRADYGRFDESLKKDALGAVIIEPTVVNREGKAFSFLVARTKDPGRVRLLISASSLKDKGFLHHPEQLAPVLAKEFQWVVSKADTAPKPKPVSTDRDVKQAAIRSDREILAMSGEERARLLQRLFGTYLRTVDEQNSLEGQPSYEVGTTTLIPPAHPDSTTKFYDIRVREALQQIVREPYFQDKTSKAVRSLLNGKIWNVSFVKIDQRDWATRTRVLPEDKAVAVGEPSRTIQPATILVNTYRTAAPDDPFYRETQGLPMGALSVDQLARVIAWEIEQNIIEKSMRGHVAQDEMTAPK